jgi:hypothetical protein
MPKIIKKKFPQITQPDAEKDITIELRFHISFGINNSLIDPKIFL